MRLAGRILVSAIAAALLAMQAAGAATVAISCGAVGQEIDVCKAGTVAWAQQTGHEVNLISTPHSSSERLELYQQLLAAGAADVDVFQIDVIWPGILADHLIDLKPYLAQDAIDRHFPALIRNNTVGGRLVAMPWFTDAGLLYYRKDLLEKHAEKAPETWDQLTALALKIQGAERAAGNEGFWGFLWQGLAYEGLTCDALEWVASHNGGTIVEPDGTVSIDNPNAVRALEMAAGWVGTITPEGVLKYAEEESRGLFQAGKALFMRNWPYAWSLLQAPDSPVKDKVGVAALPKGGADGRHAAALGGWQLAVSKYSRHPEIAADLIRYLTGEDEQKRRALAGAYNPTIASLYQDEEVLAANPFFGELYEVFTGAVPRPSSVTGNKYHQVSQAFWEAVHQVLSGQTGAADSLAQLASQLRQLSRDGRW